MAFRGRFSRNKRGSRRGFGKRRTLHKAFRSKSGKSIIADFATEIRCPAFPPVVNPQILDTRRTTIEKSVTQTAGGAVVTTNFTIADLRKAVAELFVGGTALSTQFLAYLVKAYAWCNSSDVSLELSENITGRELLKEGRQLRPACAAFEWPINKRQLVDNVASTTTQLMQIRTSAAVASTYFVTLHLEIKILVQDAVNAGPTVDLSLIPHNNWQTKSKRFSDSKDDSRNGKYGPEYELVHEGDLGGVERMRRLEIRSPSIHTIDDLCSNASCGIERPHKHRRV